MSSTVEIISLTRQPRDVSRFLNFAYAIYGDDPNWVAPLLMDVKKVFSNENPMFSHAEMQLWIARRAAPSRAAARRARTSGSHR